ncbi:UNKNOWN [Stylonychia lemnae]|uniref:Uncharacterized protein n=1 Tax=Stylonychia lemnae TaxID=5949 RepID=A0A078APR9_STYLE|nr:UNKNOWN [Stylonychia lemnae]|eukprot:CDW84164.1 UNKNOWN [Stylonychia lemnae]
MQADQYRYQPASRFAQSIEEIYRRTNKNLNTGIYTNSGNDFYRIDSSNINSSKRIDDYSYQQYQQPSISSQQARTAAIAFYPGSNQQAFKPSSSNGFSSNANSIQMIPQSHQGYPINNQKTIYVRSNDGAGNGTIDHNAPEEFDFGTIGEDIEAHYVQANQLQSRGRSLNSRIQAPSQLLRTIDDGVNMHRDIIKNQRTVFDDEIEERQRIFEDEIIKRIKIIQNFVKNLDAKFTKFRERAAKRRNEDNQPEKLSTLNNMKSPQNFGSLSQNDIKDLIKWEIEALEKKTEDRVSKIEQNNKLTKKKTEDEINIVREETQNEFENIKQQFEDFGNSIYDRVTNDLLSQIQQEIKSQSNQLQTSLREEANSIVMAGLTQNDKKIMGVEAQLEDIKISQEQSVEELSKYQDGLEQLMDQNKFQLQDNINNVKGEFEKFKQQIKKDIKKEIDDCRFVKDDEFQEQIDHMRQQIQFLQASKNTASNQSDELKQNKIDQEELYRLEKKLSQKIQDIDQKFSNQDLDLADKNDLNNLQANIMQKISELDKKYQNIQELQLDQKNSYKKDFQQQEKVNEQKLQDFDRRLTNLQLQLENNKFNLQNAPSTNAPSLILQNQSVQPEFKNSIPVEIKTSNKNQFDFGYVEPVQQFEEIDDDWLNPGNKQQKLEPEIKKAEPQVMHRNVNKQKGVGSANPSIMQVQQQKQTIEQIPQIDEVQPIKSLDEDYHDDWMKPKPQPVIELGSQKQVPEEKKKVQNFWDDPEEIDDIQQIDEYEDELFDPYVKPKDEPEVFKKNEPLKDKILQQQPQIIPDKAQAKKSPIDYGQLNKSEEIVSFEEAMQNVSWDEYANVQENVELYIDNFIEYQVERLMKDYGKQNPKVQRLIDESVFSYL